MKKHILLAPALALVLLGAGCTSTNTASTDTSRGAKAPVAAEETVTLPEGFPKDIPVYANATITEAEKTGETDGDLSISTTDSMQTVAAWYDAQLTGAGWKKTAGNEGKSISAVYEKDGMNLSLSVLQIGTEIRANISKTTY